MASSTSTSTHHSKTPIVTDVRTGEELRGASGSAHKAGGGPQPGMGSRAVDTEETGTDKSTGGVYGKRGEDGGRGGAGAGKVEGA